jgi:hypothetical protein
MVGGIEIIGLALAIPPLIMGPEKTALYVTSPVVAILNRKKHKDWVEEEFRDLNFEITIFNETLNGFIDKLPLDETAKRRLRNVDKLSHKAWTEASEDLWPAFRCELGEKTDSFVNHMEVFLVELEGLISDGRGSKSQTYPIPLTKSNIVSMIVDMPRLYI